VFHVVRSGETIYRISRYYHVRVEDVVRANRIRDVTSVPVGKKLWIPGARGRQPGGPLMQTASLPPATRGDRRNWALREANLDLRWPVRGRVSSGFGWRNGRHHDGIDIPARRGTPIRAAEAGRVIHSGGGLGAYGQVVILKHAGRYKTVYAHNRANRVRKGQFVEKGDVIAEVGSSGNASGPHVHFEVRRDRQPQDPLRYLP
jgi:murein DD-endopeptidase MepM/ murein hydrolase activator NlpD